MSDRDDVGESPDDPCTDLFFQWKTLPATPLDADLSVEHAIEALEKFVAWARWGGCVLSRNQDPVDVAAMLQQVRDVLGVLDNVRVEAMSGRADASETHRREIIYTVVLRVEDCARSFASEDAALDASVMMIEKFAPTLAARCNAAGDLLRTVIASFKTNKPRKAVATLIRLLDETKTHSLDKDLHDTFREWERTRHARVPRRASRGNDPGP